MLRLLSPHTTWCEREVSYQDVSAMRRDERYQCDADDTRQQSDVAEGVRYRQEPGAQAALDQVD